MLHHEIRAFTPASVNDQERMVDLVASTGVDVPRQDIEGPFIERLTMTADAIDLSRVQQGAVPLLDSHRQDGVDSVLGNVRKAQLQNGSLIVQAQFSLRADPVWQDVKGGIIRNVSIGYEPLEFDDQVDRSTGQRVRNVTKWRLMEVSLVALAADAGAKTRSQEMTVHPTIPNPQTTTPPATVTRTERNAEIRALGETFGTDTATINGLIDRDATVDEARAAVLDAMRTARPAAFPRVTMLTQHDAPELIVSRMGEALFARSNPRHQVGEAARTFMGLTTLDMARQCLRMRGFSTTGLSPADTITRALQTTSDYPNIFADTAYRSLRTAYEAAPAVLKAVARQTAAKDFRAKTRIQVDTAVTLEKVNEAGEYKYGAFAGDAETYKIDTYGKIVGLSRQAIINDDLGAFNDLAGKLGTGAAEFEAQFFADLLISGAGNGPVMSDGKNLFDAAHGNKGADHAPPSEGPLSEARLAMRRQKSILGKPVNAAPRFMLVPPELETAAEMQLAEIQPTKSDDVNPFGGKLQLLVEARLADAFRWYLVGDPARIDGLEYAYLQGAEGPQTETRAGFEVDGVEVKVRLDFGAAFLDWRGWFMNPGH